MRGILLAGLFGGLLGGGALPAPASTFNEVADAGVTPATATQLPAGTTAVTGSLLAATPADVDLYRFGLDTALTLTIRALYVTGDGNLLLFDALGRGLAGDDDNDSGCANNSGLRVPDSCLTVPLAAGSYFVAAGQNNIFAYASEAAFASGTSFFGNDDGILTAPTLAALGLVGAGSPGSSTPNPTSYTLEFSAALGDPAPAPVPVPGALAAMVTALGAGGALWGMRRRAG